MMTSGVVCQAVLIAATAVGGLDGLFDCLKPDKRPSHAYGGVDCCRLCGAKHDLVIRGVHVLTTHPDWKLRKQVAHDLQDFNWRHHPEIVPAVSFSLLNDPHKKVRAQAARTLMKLGACDGLAHAALAEAAEHDSHLWTRHWSKKALKRLDRRCLTDCPICGPLPASSGVIIERPDPRELGTIPPEYLEPEPREYEVPRGWDGGRRAEPYGYEYEEAPGFDAAPPPPPPGSGSAQPIPRDLVPPSQPGPTEPRSSYRPRFETPPESAEPNSTPGAGGDVLPPPIRVEPPELPPVPPAESPFGAPAPEAEATERDAEEDRERLEFFRRSRRPLFRLTIGRPR